MKVLLIAVHDEGKHGLLRYFERGLRALGHEPVLFSVYPERTRSNHVSSGGILIQRARNRLLRMTTRWMRTTEKVVHFAKKIQPDFALVIKGLDLPQAVVSALV